MYKLGKKRDYGTEEKALGEGGFASVKIYVDSEENEVAIKSPKEIGTMFPVSFVVETVTLSVIPKHPNIIEILDIIISKNSPSIDIVFPVAETNMRDYLQNNHLSREEVQDYSQQLIQGIQFLQYHDVLHRDLKPDNFLLFKCQDKNKKSQKNKKSMTLVIADFGSAKINICPEGDITPSNKFEEGPDEIGTPFYRAPEVFLGENYTSASEVWSIGTIIAELATGKTIFYTEEDNDMEQLLVIEKLWGPLTQKKWFPRARYWDKYQQYREENYKNEKINGPSWDLMKIPEDEELREVLESCLNYNPQKRINIFDLLKLSFFADVSSCVNQKIAKDRSCVKKKDFLFPIMIKSPKNIRII
jgi:serine/threonine protein kinase